MKQTHPSIDSIYQLLNEKRLKEAFVQLQSICTGAIPWKIRNQIDILSNDYNYMLTYARQGVADPLRRNFLLNILCSSYELTDKVNELLPTGKQSSLFQELIHQQEQTPYPSYAELQKRLEEITEDLGTASLFYSNPDQLKKETAAIRKKHEEVTSTLFMRTWADMGWNESEEKEGRNLLNSVMVSNFDLAVFVSALTLHLLRLFDPHKMSLLLEATHHSDITVSQRALIGIILVCIKWEERIKLYGSLSKSIKERLTDSTLQEKLYTIQLQLLQTRETKKIDRKLHDEIIPQIIKESEEMEAKNRNENPQEFNDLNPEWTRENISPSMGKTIKKIEGWKDEGADLYMSTFAPLKTHPFFKQLPHWFYPFDKEQADVAEIAEQLSDKPNNPLFFLLSFPDFCHSDKYCICTNISENFDFFKEVEIKDYIPNSTNKDSLIQDNISSPHIVSRMYIQDLYRFFHLWMRRKEEENIFQSNFHLWENIWIKDNLLTTNFQQHLADYLFRKGYYEEAYPIYNRLINEKVTSFKLWQKIGYIEEKNNEYAKAIESYQKAELLFNDKGWTKRHLAYCYFMNQQYQEAIDYYKQLLENDSENKQLLTQLGRCYLYCQKYEEALQCLHKADYLNPNQPAIIRDIIWGYLLNKQWDEGLLYHSKLENLEPLNATDWMNAAHLCYMSKQLTKALEYYQKALKLCKNLEDFISKLRKDKDELLKLGMKNEDFYILIDLLV